MTNPQNTVVGDSHTAQRVSSVPGVSQETLRPEDFLPPTANLNAKQTNSVGSDNEDVILMIQRYVDEIGERWPHLDVSIRTDDCAGESNMVITGESIPPRILTGAAQSFDVAIGGVCSDRETENCEVLIDLSSRIHDALVEEDPYFRSGDADKVWQPGND